MSLRTLPYAHCPTHNAQRTMPNAHCPMHTSQRTLPNAHCTIQPCITLHIWTLFWSTLHKPTNNTTHCTQPWTVDNPGQPYTTQNNPGQPRTTLGQPWTTLHNPSQTYSTLNTQHIPVQPSTVYIPYTFNLARLRPWSNLARLSPWLNLKIRQLTTIISFFLG